MALSHDQFQPDVTVILRGIMLMCFNEDRTRSDIGIVRNIDQHKLEVRVEKLSAGNAEILLQLGAEGLQKEMWVNVEKAGEIGIKLFTPGAFDRNGEESADFRWAIDFEGPEFFNQPLKIDANELHPIIRLNDGLFYTRDVSEGAVTRVGANPGPLGRVALELGVDIKLDAEGDKVVLMNGDQEALSLEKQEGVSYLIVVDRSCPEVPGRRPKVPGAEPTKPESDFKHFFKAIKPPRGAEIDLVLDEPDPEENTPDARCTLGTLSQTTSLG